MSSDPTLPDHVIYNILLFLPVKTLLRCHCLSKQWYQTLTSNNFATDKLFTCTTNNTSYVLLMCASAGCSYICAITNGQVVVRKVDLPLVIRTSKLFCQVSSSCHGLVCLVYHDNDTAILLIWNPLTNFYREISWPELLATVECANNAFVGFGFDKVAKVYKIVVSTHHGCSGGQSYVMTLGTNEWRKIDDSLWKQYWRGDFDSGSVFSMGTIYWLGRDLHSFIQVLLKFNLMEERLTVYEMVKKGNNNNGNSNSNEHRALVKLGQHKGLLCYNYYDKFLVQNEGSYLLRAWIHKEKNNKDEWGMVSQLNENDFSLSGNRLQLVPLGFDSNDHLVLTCNDGRGIVIHHRVDEKYVMEKLDELVEHEVDEVHFLEMESLICP